MSCSDDHRYEGIFQDLPVDQGGAGRHRCAGCAYNRGVEAGSRMDESPVIDLESLPESQAGAVRHKSPHAAWALGYFEGVRQYYSRL